MLHIELVVKAFHFEDCWVLVPKGQRLGDEIATADEGAKNNDKPKYLLNKGSKYINSSILARRQVPVCSSSQ